MMRDGEGGQTIEELEAEVRRCLHGLTVDGKRLVAAVILDHESDDLIDVGDTEAAVAQIAKVMHEPRAKMSAEEQARVAAERRDERLLRSAQDNWEQTKANICEHLRCLLLRVHNISDQEERAIIHTAITVIQELQQENAELKCEIRLRNYEEDDE